MTAIFRMPYGAFELKRCYQKNMLIGTAAMVLFAALIIGGVSIYLALNPPVVIAVDPPPIGGRIDIDPSFDINPVRPKLPIGTRPKPPQKPGGKYIPVPVDSLDDDTSLIIDPPNEPYGNGLDSNIIEGEGNGGAPGVGGAGPGVLPIPPPGIFIPMEKPPVLVKEVKPDYPKLARTAGFGGKVIIQAYVDRTGCVKIAKAVKCSRPGMGFEEEAVKAAIKSIYRPAIQNGEPIGVWISYVVRYTLDE